MCKFVISTKDILANFAKVKKSLRPSVKVCVVVKANAYGFGMAKICRLLEHRADYYAVARLSEFLALREVSKKACVILTPLSGKENKIAIKAGAEITISDSTNLEQINLEAKKCGIVGKVHLKLDTGMNRYGIKGESSLRDFLDRLRKLENIELVGCYSHLYSIDPRSIAKQRKLFERYKKIIVSNGFNPLFHLANSCGIKDEANYFDMVRLGIDLYESENHKFVCQVAEIKQVSKGETISYGATFKAKKNMLVAVCSAGYADGVRRSLSNKGYVLIRGKRANIIGRVCMDCFMVDLSSVKNAKVGDEVVVFGKSGENYISVCEMAKLCDTITYEVYTGLSSRVKRLYTWRSSASNSGKIWGKKTP